MKPGDLVQWSSTPWEGFNLGGSRIGIILSVKDPSYVFGRRTIYVNVLDVSGEIRELPINVLEVIS